MENDPRKSSLSRELPYTTRKVSLGITLEPSISWGQLATVPLETETCGFSKFLSPVSCHRRLLMTCPLSFNTSLAEAQAVHLLRHHARAGPHCAPSPATFLLVRIRSQAAPLVSLLWELELSAGKSKTHWRICAAPRILLAAVWGSGFSVTTNSTSASACNQHRENRPFSSTAKLKETLFVDGNPKCPSAPFLGSCGKSL